MKRRLALLLVVLTVGSMGFHAAPADPRPPDPSDLRGGPTDYVTLTDGTSIAVNVVVPPGCRSGSGYVPCPVMFEMAGYENGSSSASGRTTLGNLYDYAHSQGYDGPSPPLTGDSHDGTSAFRYDGPQYGTNGTYISVHASVRGTGCSSGEFDLFSEQSAMDGYDIIENWIVNNAEHTGDADHPGWLANGKVNIIGHSYSGITGFMVAAIEGRERRAGHPSHLVSVTVSGLIDDLYRGIVYPGGVSDLGFPLEWTVGVRPAYDVLGGTVQGIFRNGIQPDAAHQNVAAKCALNLTTHRRTVLNDPVVQGLNDTDNDWWKARALTKYAPMIDVPIHITGAFQDEQTGPRGPSHLWQMIGTDEHGNALPKRLVLLNGDHGSNVDLYETWADRKAWVDYWNFGYVDTFDPNGDQAPGVTSSFVDPGTAPISVRTLFEVHKNAGMLVSNGHLDTTSFPIPSTAITPYFLCGGSNGNTMAGALQATACADEGSAAYVSGSKRQAWNYTVDDTGQGMYGPPATTKQAPDELDFISPAFTTAKAIDGPITATLFASATANDTEFFVQVIDRDLTVPGHVHVSFLQRGLLKASHRAIIDAVSDHFGTDPVEGSPWDYRPYRPHTNPTDIMPLETYKYLIEIFPVAHVFRPGHALQIKIMAPPASDSEYAYVPKSIPVGLNTIYFGGDQPSRVTLPFVPVSSILDFGSTGPLCGQYDRVRCTTD